MLTRMIPSFAVANWVITHSAQFGAQMPARSPLTSPRPASERAARSTVWPIVSPSSGVVPSPCEYDSAITTSSAACDQPPSQQLLSRAQRPQEPEAAGERHRVGHRGHRGALGVVEGAGLDQLQVPL